MHPAGCREEEKPCRIEQGWMRKFFLLDLAEPAHLVEPSLLGLQA